MALPVVLYGLAIIAALAAAAFWTLLSDRRAGRATIALQKAMGDAERATLVPLGAWEVARYNSMPVGATVEHLGRGGTPRATVRRLSQRLFEIIGTGFGAGGSGVQRTGLLVHLPFPLEILPGPLITAGSVVGDEGGAVRVRRGTPGDEVCAAGESEFVAAPEPFAHEVSPNRFESIPAWVLLTNKVVPPGRYVGVRPSYSGSACQLQDIRNWGAPNAPGTPCDHHRPVILVQGDLEVDGGVGQGTLLVEGDLLLGGGFTFAGLILVGGDLRIRGRGTRVVGAVQVGGPAGGVSTHLGGEVRIDYAPCLVRNAMAAGGRATPLPSRAWFYLVK
jgi:hypothetical protein